MENLEALLNQAYTNFRVIIVTDSTDDPAYSVVSTVLKRHNPKRASLYCGRSPVRERESSGVTDRPE